LPVTAAAAKTFPKRIRTRPSARALDLIRILLLNVRGVLGDVIKAMLRACET